MARRGRLIAPCFLPPNFARHGKRLRKFGQSRGWTIASRAVIIGHLKKRGPLGGNNMPHNLKSRTLAWVAGATVALAACAMFAVSANAQNKEPIKIGFGMSLTGPLAANGKRRCWHEDLGRGDQRQGRPARPAGQARLLRRPEQARHRARHLHQAARRRQSRSDRRRLRVRPDRARDADCDPEGEALHQPVRHRRERTSSNTTDISR